MIEAPLMSIPQKLRSVAKRIAKDSLFGRRIPAAYRAAAQAPVDPRKVVFLENKDDDLPDSFALVERCARERYGLDTVFISLHETSVPRTRYFENCVAAAREIATARYVFLNDASQLASCLPLRPETKIAQLWHACGAFKKWGMSTAGLAFGGTREELLRHPYYGNLSLVTVSSPDVAWAYAEAMVLDDAPGIIKPLGVSRTDVFFDDAFLAGARAQLEHAFPQAEGKKVILYAPTFRGHVSNATGPDALDVRALIHAIGDEYVLVVKHHPFVKHPTPIPDDCQDFAFLDDGSLPIDVLLSCADVCISDYSSLVFEYSLFGRPMAFFAYDLDEYKDWRNFYYDYDELTPGPVLATNEELIDYLTHVDERFDAAQVEAFRAKFMSACDGHATERICTEMFGDAPARDDGRNGEEVRSNAAPRHAGAPSEPHGSSGFSNAEAPDASRMSRASSSNAATVERRA